MARRVVVIGAGPGGLAAALLLARAGAEVEVIERQPQVGGRNGRLQGDGFTFDIGPTFFLYPAVLEEIFAAVGRDLLTEVPMQRLDPQYRILFGQGGQLDCTAEVANMAAQIGALSPRDAPAFERFLAENREKFARFKPCLEMPYARLGDLLNTRMLRLLPFLRPHQSLDRYLGRFFHDERIRLAFSFQSKYLGMSPFRCPSLFSILSFLEYEHGVWHPFGGCTALSTAMARIATELGVTLRLGEPVEEILLEGRRAVGVRTSQGRTRADAVVVNADFAHAMTSLVPNAARRRWTNARIERSRYSCSTYMLYLGLEGRYDHLAHHNIYISADYRANLAAIEETFSLPADPSLYVQNASLTDDSLAPPGHSTLYVLVPVPHQHRNLPWSQLDAPFRDQALDQLAKLGLPDLRQRIRFERRITPADWQSAGIYRGATFNLAHNLGQMLNFRPHNRFEDLDRTYLVGGGTHPGSGLPVIFESALISARLAAADLGLDAAPAAVAVPATVCAETAAP